MTRFCRGVCCFASCSATWVIWSSGSNVAWSGSGRYGHYMGYLAGPIGELQCRPTGFWSTFQPPFVDNYSFWGTVLSWLLGLSRDWTFTMGYLLIMQTELPIMNLVFSDLPSHKLGCAQQQFIIKWKWYIQYQAKAGSEGTSKLFKVTQMFMHPTPGTKIHKSGYSRETDPIEYIYICLFIYLFKVMFLQLWRLIILSIWNICS